MPDSGLSWIRPSVSNGAACVVAVAVVEQYGAVRSLVGLGDRSVKLQS